MDVLANDNELLKYAEIWYKIVDLFNKKHNKRVLYNNTTYNECIIKLKISPYNKKLHRNTKILKDEYYGHSLLLLESICELENKYCPQTFLDEFFECSSIGCSSVKTHNTNNENSLFKELVQIVDWSDDEF